MRRTVRFIAFCLKLTVCLAIACETPYNDILGVCLYFSTTQLSWCKAQQYCSDIDGELVRGKNYLPLSGKTAKGFPKHYWIGLTDYLQERGNSRSGWRWTDGSVVPPSSDLVWNNSQPLDRYDDCAAVCTGNTKGELCATYTSAKMSPMCQPRQQPSSAHQSRDFKVDMVSTEWLPYHHYASESGCKRYVRMARTAFDCAVACREEPKGWCVSFYYRSKQFCYLVLYTDIKYDISDDPSWMKFTVQN